MNVPVDMIAAVLEAVLALAAAIQKLLELVRAVASA